MEPKPCPTPHKRAYSKPEARQQLRKAWKTMRGRKMPTRIYPCRCGNYHLTAQPYRSRHKENA